MKLIKKEEKYGKNAKHFGEKPKKYLKVSALICLGIGVIVYLFSQNFTNAIIAIVGFFVLFQGYFFTKQKMKSYGAISKMEDVFPDFIDLMASNLRAGITIDRALLMSSRKEFDPLDKEIMRLGKDILTGKDVSVALGSMAKRINSDKITKTINLIISGIRSGGNLSVLLEETAANMRERNFVEKRAASNVLMYVIFIFFAVALGAPVLFGLSSVLVEILTKLLTNIPVNQANISLPFTLTKINISVKFIIYFSVIFIIISDILASFVLGLVSKGNERDGIKYMVPLILVSLAAFFASRILLIRYFAEFFS